MKIIQCAVCGARQFFKNTAENINSLIAFGWAFNGHGLLCPVCVDEQVKLNYAMLRDPQSIAAVIKRTAREVT